jgi:hypothetical protein
MTIEEEIVSLVLDQPNRLATLIGVFDELPTGLTTWFMGTANTLRKSADYTEIDIATYVNPRINALPADIIIRKNRDPVVGDIVEICALGDMSNYVTGTVKVTKINVKEGTVNIQNITEPDGIGTVLITNIMYVIEAVAFGTPRWESIIQSLDIEFDVFLYKNHAEAILEQLREAEELDDKDEIIVKLEDRLKKLG